MNFGTPVDIEDMLQSWLNSRGVKAAAPPVPADLSAPIVYVHSTGGSELSYVLDSRNVSVDCYARTWAAATELANETVGMFRSLPYGDELPVYDLTVTALPYNNPDPNHANVPRATFSAIVVVRSTI